MNAYITIEELLEKLQWMLPSPISFNINEMITHVYDSMRIIGGLNSNTKDNITLTLVDNRCKIPAEVEDIFTIHYNDKIYGTFPLNKVSAIDTGMTFVYMIWNGYIYSDIKEGNIYVDISLLPLDPHNRPMIPNKIYYEKAVLHYMFERLMYKAYLQDQIDERKYERIRQDWIFYCGSAKSASILPRRDEENVFNSKTLTVFSKLKRFTSSTYTERKNIPSVPFNDLDQLLTTQSIDPLTSTTYNHNVANNGASS